MYYLWAPTLWQLEVPDSCLRCALSDVFRFTCLLFSEVTIVCTKYDD